MFTRRVAILVTLIRECRLIKPDVNPENNYRKYSQSNVDELVQISVLRQLDVSVKLIKDILLKPKMLKDSLEQHLTSLNNEINRLGKSKNVLMSCLHSMSDPNAGISGLTKQLLLLNKSLEMDEREREGFMKREVQRIFPGNFGKMLVISYSPFLNSPIDTKEKEAAWLNLVKFLDEVEGIEYPEELIEIYKNLTRPDMEKIEKSLTKNIEKWIGITEEELVAERIQFFETMNRMDADMQVAFQKTSRMGKSMKEQMKKVSFYDQFNENLKVLSRDYYEYTNTINEFTQSLNVKINDKGDIEVAE